MTTRAIPNGPSVSTLSRIAQNRWAWAVLFLVAVTALTIGSVHRPPPSDAARAASLDSVIKCPSCQDLSIAQSDAGVATALRGEVRRLVDRGWSNQRIERFVVAQYGSDEILAPSSNFPWLVPLVIGGLAAFAVGIGLVRARLQRRRRASADEEELVEAAMRHLKETPWAT